MAQMAKIIKEREIRRPGVTVVPSQDGTCILFGMTRRQGRCSMIFRDWRGATVSMGGERSKYSAHLATTFPAPPSGFR